MKIPIVWQFIRMPFWNVQMGKFWNHLDQKQLWYSIEQIKMFLLMEFGTHHQHAQSNSLYCLQCIPHGLGHNWIDISEWPMLLTTRKKKQRKNHQRNLKMMGMVQRAIHSVFFSSFQPCTEYVFSHQNCSAIENTWQFTNTFGPSRHSKANKQQRKPNHFHFFGLYKRLSFRLFLRTHLAVAKLNQRSLELSLAFWTFLVFG